MIEKPNHKRRAPKQGVRNRFTAKDRHKVYEREDGLCQNCGGRGSEVHHCYPRGRGGRGVLSNALLLCDLCHRLIHRDNDLMDFWIDKYTDRFGPKFWQDEHERS